MANPENLTLRQVRYFTAVAESRSLRHAAERLNVTQPSLTAQIAALEKGLGLKLFERSRSGTRLSPSGTELLVNARRVLEEVQGLHDRALSLSSGAEGTFRLGVTPTLGPYLLPRILPRIHASHAGLKLYVREAAPSDLEDALKNGEHDLILTTEPVLSRDLTVARLFREPLKLAMPVDHRLATKKRINRSDMVGEKVLTIGEHHLFHRQISQLCESLGADLLRDYEGTSLDTLRHMVVMGMGVAFLPALYVKSEIRERDELRVAPVEGIKMFRSQVLVWRPASPSRQLLSRCLMRFAASLPTPSPKMFPFTAFRAEFRSPT